MSEDQSSNGSGSKSWLDRIARVFSSEPRDREELKELINESSEKGILDAEALAMIEGALAVSEMQVRDAMVPRSQMVVIPLDMPLDEFLPLILESGHSRFPVIGEDRDEVEGVLLAKDLLRHYSLNSGPLDLIELVREKPLWRPPFRFAELDLHGQRLRIRIRRDDRPYLPPWRSYAFGSAASLLLRQVHLAGFRL